MEEDRAQPAGRRKKRLRFRSWHRGTKEMDLLLGRFADARLAVLGDAQLDDYEALLSVSDPDLYNWISGLEPVPDDRTSPVLKLIIEFHNTPQDAD